MDKILQALYNGEIYPAEQYRPLIEEYKILRNKHYEHYEDFIKKIGSPLDKEFEHIMDEQLDTLPLELSEMFIDGFRLGARMMLEIFEDKYKTEE
ncbi:DUF6809 family protein [Enterocloster bolteae]|uniref:DUF6809 family protein n=1 Tax=Enterocloster bolteae TaxID=208479 RepID=UPI00189D1E86|nr:DUF6809 family protein [Enterocloster bolteae]